MALIVIFGVPAVLCGLVWLAGWASESENPALKATVRALGAVAVLAAVVFAVAIIGTPFTR